MGIWRWAVSFSGQGPSLSTEGAHPGARKRLRQPLAPAVSECWKGPEDHPRSAQTAVPSLHSLAMSLGRRAGQQKPSPASWQDLVLQAELNPARTIGLEPGLWRGLGPARLCRGPCRAQGPAGPAGGEKQAFVWSRRAGSCQMGLGWTGLGGAGLSPQDPACSSASALNARIFERESP